MLIQLLAAGLYQIESLYVANVLEGALQLCLIQIAGTIRDTDRVTCIFNGSFVRLCQLL